MERAVRLGMGNAVGIQSGADGIALSYWRIHFADARGDESGEREFDRADDVRSFAAGAIDAGAFGTTAAAGRVPGDERRNRIRRDKILGRGQDRKSVV